MRYLREALPDTYTLVPQRGDHRTRRPAFEYDLIVVAPHAIYAVEVKRWRGGIRGDDDTWLVGGQHHRPNPWLTVNNKARVLKSQIQRRQPACADVWAEAAVTIAEGAPEEVELNLPGRCRERVFRYTELPAFLTDREALGDKAGDWRPQRLYLEKAVQETRSGRSERPLAFGPYQVLETLARHNRDAEYLARNVHLRGDKRVRLRVFSYDPYLPPDELAQRYGIICRESEALCHGLARIPI